MKNNENIRYRFIHANDELNKLDDLVFNITLDGQSTWERSIIPSISMKDVNGVVKVVNPAVWYCMTADPDFDNIDAEHGWSQEDPTGKTVYGVQVDYRTPITTDDFAYIDGSNLTQIFIYEKTKFGQTRCCQTKLKPRPSMTKLRLLLKYRNLQ